MKDKIKEIRSLLITAWEDGLNSFHDTKLRKKYNDDLSDFLDNYDEEIRNLSLSLPPSEVTDERCGECGYLGYTDDTEGFYRCDYCGAKIRKIKQHLPSKREVTDEEIISIVKSFIVNSCSNHTPYRGACVTCGKMKSYKLIRDPDKLVEKLRQHLPSKSDELVDKMHNQLTEGRDFLMQHEGGLTVSDCLEAFGFGRNGLG